MRFDVFLWENLLQHLLVRLMGFGHILDRLIVGVEDISVGLDDAPASEDEDEAEECWEAHDGETSDSC